jgi:alkylated DNA repair dioxygenase AlkB
MHTSRKGALVSVGVHAAPARACHAVSPSLLRPAPGIFVMRAAWTLDAAAIALPQRTTLWATLCGGGAPAQRLKAECRRIYLDRGFVHLPSLVDLPTVESLVGECTRCVKSGATFLSSEDHNPYLKNDDPTLSCSHPRNRPMASSKTIVDYSRAGSNSALSELYRSELMLGLIQAIVSPEQQLYPAPCPISSAYYNVFEEGDGLGWHYDNSEFGVNLVLQMAGDPHRGVSGGGEFEFHLNTRSDADPDSFASTERLLDSGCPSTDQDVQLAHDLRPGSLVVFSGRHSLHRVTPVLPGVSPRINVIFTYEKQQGAMANDYVLRKFFGRTANDQRQLLEQTVLRGNPVSRL